jgi:N utilization substance protein B
MINRRIIRIKVFQTLFAYFSGSFDNINEADKDLRHTFKRIYDLYHYLLLLLVELNDYASRKAEFAKKKFNPSEEDLNPNTRFLKNKIIAQLRENRQLNEYVQNHKFSWNNHTELLKHLYEKLIESDDYKKYLAKETVNYDDDKLILLYLIEIIMFDSEMLYSTLEEISIYWIDNVDFVLLSVANTIDRMRIGFDMNKKLLRMMKSKEDMDFAIKLLHTVILNYQDYIKIIEKNVINWDIERISTVDKITLYMAISELLNFQEIPIKVTLNEYIELAKQYGIPNRSKVFVNGLLDKIVKDQKAEGKINKSGRGLIDK